MLDDDLRVDWEFPTINIMDNLMPTFKEHDVGKKFGIPRTVWFVDGPDLE